METNYEPTLEELKKQDLDVIKKTRMLFRQAYLDLTKAEPERFADYSYDQFEKLYIGYMISSMNKVCDKYGIDIGEVVNGL